MARRGVDDLDPAPMTEPVELPELRFDERGLIPAVVQDATSGEVLMVAWMNDEAVRRTVDSGRTWFWSRSRQELWRKGDTSGNVQHVHELRYDCDADSLLVRVRQEGPACHTGHRSCFFQRLDAPAEAG